MYSVGLIGYGRWGKTLLPYLEHLFDVKAVFGRSIAREGRFTNNLDDVLSSDTDAVAIATPIGTHYEIARKALSHNKHVFCEKPLATRPSLARELGSIATQKKLHLVTDYTYTFLPKLKKARTEIIENKKSGKLQKTRLALKRKSKNDESDIYWNLASHMLAVLDMFTDIEELKLKAENVTSKQRAVISFTGDTEGRILVDSGSSDKQTRAVFICEHGFTICNNLHGGEGLRYAMEYFKGVLDGWIDNDINVKTAIAVTDILYSLDKEK